MDGERDRVRWDPGGCEIEITTGERNVTVAGLADAPLFEAETDDGEMARAVWLSPAEAVVLARMARYIIANVKIRPESRELLEGLAPRFEALWPGQEG